jgi:two-component system nitrate/nitrite response regulator NarL
MGRQSGITVLVCEHALLREGLSRILSAADFRVAGTAAHVEELAPDLLKEEKLILLILDVSNDQNAIINQVKSFRASYPTARIALLADRDQLSDENIASAFRCGADAYFMKPSCDTFLKSLELVMLGETILPPKIISFFLRQHGELVSAVEERAEFECAPIAYTETSNARSPRLSAREQCILRYLIEGDSNKTIARKNDIAEATVKVHVKAILRKIRVNNRTQAAIWAMNHDGYIEETKKAASVVAVWGAGAPANLSTIASNIDPQRLRGDAVTTSRAPIHQHPGDCNVV